MCLIELHIKLDKKKQTPRNDSKESIIEEGRNKEEHKF